MSTALEQRRFDRETPTGDQPLRQGRSRPSIAKLVDDRRRHKRIEVELGGRFMRENKQEFACQIVNISVGGIALKAIATVDVGERIVAYLDQIGRIEGRVVRPFEGGFALQINATQHKREKLVGQLTWFANQDTLELPEDRRHGRNVPRDSLSQITLPDCQIVQCKVLDVSLSGASVLVTPKPDIGTKLLLGRLRGRVVRHHDQGIGIEFIDIQDPTAIGHHFGR